MMKCTRDSVQVGRAVFVKESFATLCFEPRTFSYQGEVCLPLHKQPKKLKFFQCKTTASYTPTTVVNRNITKPLLSANFCTILVHWKLLSEIQYLDSKVQNFASQCLVLPQYQETFSLRHQEAIPTDHSESVVGNFKYFPEGRLVFPQSRKFLRTSKR